MKKKNKPFLIHYITWKKIIPYLILLFLYILISLLFCKFCSKKDWIICVNSVMTLLFVLIYSLVLIKWMIVRLVKWWPYSTKSKLKQMITDERYWYKSFPKKAEKEFNQKVQLQNIQFVIRYLEIKYNEKNKIKRWINKVSENFLFDQKGDDITEINEEFLSKIINKINKNEKKNIFEQSILNSLNNLISLIQDKLMIYENQFKIKNSKKDFINLIYRCFLNHKMNAYVFQVGKESQSSKNEKLVAIGKKEYKKLSIEIPNIISNCWAIRKPSMIILDFEDTYKKLRFYLENFGYKLHLIDVQNSSEDINSKKWNPLEELYWCSLLLTLLRDIQKQLLEYDLFFNSEYNETNQTIKSNKKIYDFSVNKYIPDFSVTEYLNLKDKYDEMRIDENKFEYDDSFISKNFDYINNKDLYYPLWKSRDFLDNETSSCGPHNKKIILCNDCNKEFFNNSYYLIINKIILSNNQMVNEYIEKFEKEKKELIDHFHKDFLSLIEKMCLFLELIPNEFNVNKFNLKYLKEIFIDRISSNYYFDKIKKQLEYTDNGFKILRELGLFQQEKNIEEKLNYWICKFTKKYNYKKRNPNNESIDNLESKINKYFFAMKNNSNEMFSLTKEFNLNEKPEIIFIICNKITDSKDNAWPIDLFIKLFLNKIKKEKNYLQKNWLLILNQHFTSLEDLMDEWQSYLSNGKILLLTDSFNKYFSNWELKIFLDFLDEYELITKESVLEKENDSNDKKIFKINWKKTTSSPIGTNFFTEETKNIIVFNEGKKAIFYSPFLELKENENSNNTKIINKIKNDILDEDEYKYFKALNDETKIIKDINSQYETTYCNLNFNEIIDIFKKVNPCEFISNKEFDLTIDYIKSIIDSRYSLKQILDFISATYNEREDLLKDFKKFGEIIQKIIKLKLKKQLDCFNKLKSSELSNLETKFNVSLSKISINQIIELVDQKIISIFESLIDKGLKQLFINSMFIENDFDSFAQKWINESKQKINSTNKYKSRLNSLIFENISNIKKNLKL